MVRLCVSECVGGHSVGETPGYIPNPEAKPYSADGTAGGTLWESRTPPNNLWKDPWSPAFSWDQGSFFICLWRAGYPAARDTCGTEDRSHRCPPTLPTTDRSAISGDGTVVTGPTVAAGAAALVGATTGTVGAEGMVPVLPAAATSATGTVTVTGAATGTVDSAATTVATVVTAAAGPSVVATAAVTTTAAVSAAVTVAAATTVGTTGGAVTGSGTATDGTTTGAVTGVGTAAATSAVTTGPAATSVADSAVGGT